MSGRIVVGVDGSDSSKAALRWAAAEARLRKAGLRVVHAWSYPLEAASLGAIAPVPVDWDAIRTDAEQFAAAAVAEVLGDDPGVPIERVTASGSASAALVEAAEGADLLVVGSRGLGGFAGLLLGSTGQQCVHHAPCPVVIVREPHAST